MSLRACSADVRDPLRAGLPLVAGTDIARALDSFWRALPAENMWRFSSADQWLSVIYRQLGLERDWEVGLRLWKRSAESRRPSDTS